MPRIRRGKPVLPLDFAILGCGYTGRHVALSLLGAGERVVVTTRHPDRLHVPGAQVVPFDALLSTDLSFVPVGARVLYSIPALDSDPAPGLFARLAGRAPARVVYLSTTSVYGAAPEVDERTPVAPRTASEQARVAAERAVLAGPWAGMVLRPAAIYGPSRGVHVRIRAGSFRLLRQGDNFISRIHVEDLAAICVRALDSNLEGAWPVADDEPCRSREIAQFCADLLRLPLPPSAEPSELHQTRRADRRVDGRAVRQLLGVELKYPSYRQGIPAALRELGFV